MGFKVKWTNYLGESGLMWETFETAVAAAAEIRDLVFRDTNEFYNDCKRVGLDPETTPRYANTYEVVREEP